MDPLRVARPGAGQRELADEDLPGICRNPPWRSPDICSPVPRREQISNVLLGAFRTRPAGTTQRLKHRESDSLAEQHWDGVADLTVPMRLRAGEAERVGERLDSRRLADGQRPMLIGVDVPVPVLRDVCGDRARELVPAEAAVLVRERVGAIPAQTLGEIDVRLTLLQQPERLEIIGAHIATDV